MYHRYRKVACFAKLEFFKFCETYTAKLIWELFGTCLFLTLYYKVVRKIRFADFIVILAFFKRFLLQNLSFCILLLSPKIDIK